MRGRRFGVEGPPLVRRDRPPVASQACISCTAIGLQLRSIMRIILRIINQGRFAHGRQAIRDRRGRHRRIGRSGRSCPQRAALHRSRIRAKTRRDRRRYPDRPQRLPCFRLSRGRRRGARGGGLYRSASADGRPYRQRSSTCRWTRRSANISATPMRWCTARTCTACCSTPAAPIPSSTCVPIIRSRATSRTTTPSPCSSMAVIRSWGARSSAQTDYAPRYAGNSSATASRACPGTRPIVR